MVGGNRDHFTEEYYTVQVSLLNIKEPDNENIPKKVMQFSASFSFNVDCSLNDGN